MNNTMIENTERSERADTQSKIERIVMQRVHLIRALRFAISSSVFSLLVSALGLWGIGREVWVARVLQNAPTNPLQGFAFYMYAFAHTHPLVQALVVLVLLAFIFLVREITLALSFISARENS